MQKNYKSEASANMSGLFCYICIMIIRTPIKRKHKKPTGELALFKELYETRGKRCQITKELLQFNISCFAHILSKGAYPSERLNPDNILMVKEEIHVLYDCSSKDKLLAKYPDAILMYEMKDTLRSLYYQHGAYGSVSRFIVSTNAKMKEQGI